MNKIVALCSGGFDSVVMLHHIKETCPDSEIHTLFFDYGQKTVNQERKCAEKASAKLGCHFHSVILPKFSWSNSQFYSPEFSGVENECLEMRNMVFLSYALSLCQSLKADSLYMAILKSRFYYDTSTPFIKKIRGIASDIGVSFETPFCEVDKYQLAYLAYNFSITNEDFFTCDNPVSDSPCGICPDCKAIKEILSFAPSPVHRFLETYDVEDSEFQKRFRKSPIDEIRVYVNHKCQLKCSHCYYGYSDLNDSPLSLDEYRGVFAQAKEMGINAFHFSGKEPLYDDSVFDIIKVLREVHPKSEVSFVTNGINVPRFKKQLRQVNPTKVCLSVDDLYTENSIRKVSGVTDKALTALNSEGIPVEIFIDIHQGNYKSIKDIITHIANKYEVMQFYIRTISPIGCAKDIDMLTSYELNKVYKQLYEVSSKVKASIHLRLSIDYTYKVLEDSDCPLKSALFGMIDRGVSEVTSNFSVLGELYCGRYESQITLTTDGYVQGCASESCFSDYCSHSIGNVRDKNLLELIKEGKEISIKENKDVFEKKSCFCVETS